MSVALSRNSCVWGKWRTYLATLGWRPVSLRNSGTKWGLGRKRTSKTRSASVGTPFLKPKLVVEMVRSPVPAAALELRVDVRAQLVHVELGGVEDDVGDVADRVEALALRADAVTTVSPRPMGCGRRVSEKRRTRASSLASRKTTRVGRTLRTFLRMAGSGRAACLRARRRPGRRVRSRGLAHEVGEARDEFQRQVVDGVEAEVLKRFERGELAGAGHAGQDHQFALLSVRRCMGSGGPLVLWCG